MIVYATPRPSLKESLSEGREVASTLRTTPTTCHLLLRKIVDDVL